MLLLCLDTATPQVGVAIGSDDQVIGRVQLARPQHHAEHLAPAIAYLLEQLDLSLDQLSAIGVGIGPGLFTGLRVGVTTAKVMAQALRIPLIAVPSLDLLAFEVRYTDRLVVPALDAKRGEVFYATYRQVPGGVQRLSDYEVGAPADVCTELMARARKSCCWATGRSATGRSSTSWNGPSSARRACPTRACRPWWSSPGPSSSGRTSPNPATCTRCTCGCPTPR